MDRVINVPIDIHGVFNILASVSCTYSQSVHRLLVLAIVSRLLVLVTVSRLLVRNS